MIEVDLNAIQKVQAVFVVEYAHVLSIDWLQILIKCNL